MRFAAWNSRPAYKAAGFTDVSIALRTHSSSFASFDGILGAVHGGAQRLGCCRKRALDPCTPMSVSLLVICRPFDLGAKMSPHAAT